MNLADHICELPRERDRKRWWTCPECGQLWRHDGHSNAWKLTMREATDA